MDKNKEITVTIPELKKKITANPNFSILDILNANHILIYAPCAGKGLCGKCKIKVSGKVTPLTAEEKNILTEEEITAGVRLACKTFMKTKAELQLFEPVLKNESKEKIKTVVRYNSKSRITKALIKPEKPTIENGFSAADSILKELNTTETVPAVIQKIANIDFSQNIIATLYNNELIDIDNTDTRDFKYAVAVDLGTTTLACYLINLNSGEQIVVQSSQNPQSGYGSDVMSRIHYCLEHKDGAEILSKLVKDAINDLICKVADEHDIPLKYIYQCVIVGNTVMNHLFFGFDTKTLSEIPFYPVSTKMITQRAQEAGIKINENGKIVFLPNIGGFVGSDTVGCIIEGGFMSRSKEYQLLIDLGTNGEIVLFADREKSYACSTAAGPAFEGARVFWGMQALEGAINSFWCEEDGFKFSTVEGASAKGICGSGLIDIMAELLRNKMIEVTGKIVEPEKIDNVKLRKRILNDGKKKKIIIAYASESYYSQDIVLTQKDIREIQLAKAAVNAGINILLKTADIKYSQISQLLITGAFGNFINKNNALEIGLFPNHLSKNKIKSLGNAAGGGAKIFLCNRALTEQKLEKYLSNIEHVEISMHPDFQNEFVGSMSF